MKWEQWLTKNIFMDDGVYNYAPRHLVISDFVKSGLMPLIKQMGYHTQYTPKIITEKILRIMWFMYEGKTLYPLNKQNEFPHEHYETYRLKLDDGLWDHFWRKWKDIQDFSVDHGYAWRLQYSLPLFIWNWLDLPNSRAFLELEHEYEDMYADDDHAYSSKGRNEDPYLNDLRSGNIILDKHYG
jgi:hypothetical protein